MSLSKTIAERCNGCCELCGAENAHHEYEVSEAPAQTPATIGLCDTCFSQITSSELSSRHWQCLKDSMWHQEPAIQVMAWRLLKRLDSEIWAQDALDMLYLDETLQHWADAGLAAENGAPVHLDSNGTKLSAGDNVVVIKDLDVKGTRFVAKRGTAVRGIALSNNPEHIEGKVNGTRIVLLTKYVKKS